MKTKSVLMSILMIGVVAMAAGAGTLAYFSDVETSGENTLTAGIVDIKVDGQNPWTKSYSGKLSDMKPCETRYIEFTVKNRGNSNPIHLWKHINITERSGGVMTEPECEAEGGTWSNNDCDGETARDNLDPYIIYDMNISFDGGATWETIISEDHYVRLDIVDCAWIYLGQLAPGEKMIVNQSYHLSSWPDAPEPEVGNWAQGDKLKFNIDLYAEQLGGPGPKGAQGLLVLDNKNPTTWNPITGDGISATLAYKTSGPKFDYSLSGKTKDASTLYCLIYYADPWTSKGSGMSGVTGALIGKATSNADRTISMSGPVELGTDLPNVDDQNYPAGAKIWLIPCTHYDTGTTGSQGKMTAWSPSEYLFEMNLITYDDTDV